MKRKTVGIGIIVILAGGHPVRDGRLGDGSRRGDVRSPRAARRRIRGALVATDENPALEALKYACPFH